jgi:hypothetical protein
MIPEYKFHLKLFHPWQYVEKQKVSFNSLNFDNRTILIANKTGTFKSA